MWIILFALVIVSVHAQAGERCTTVASCGSDSRCWLCQSPGFGDPKVCTVKASAIGTPCYDWDPMTVGETCQSDGGCRGTSIMCYPCVADSDCTINTTFLRDTLGSAVVWPWMETQCIYSVCSDDVRYATPDHKCCGVGIRGGQACDDGNPGTVNETCNWNGICGGLGVSCTTNETMCNYDSDCTSFVDVALECAVGECINNGLPTATCVVTPAPFNLSCGVGGHCDLTGNCIEPECYNNASCAPILPTGTLCSKAVCIEGVCVAMFLSADTPCGVLNAGRCNTMGTCIYPGCDITMCNITADCPVPTTSCYNYTCTSDHECIRYNFPQYQPCNTSIPCGFDTTCNMCDGDGECVIDACQNATDCLSPPSAEPVLGCSYNLCHDMHCTSYVYPINTTCVLFQLGESCTGTCQMAYTYPYCDRAVSNCSATAQCLDDNDCVGIYPIDETCANITCDDGECVLQVAPMYTRCNFTEVECSYRTLCSLCDGTGNCVRNSCINTTNCAWHDNMPVAQLCVYETCEDMKCIVHRHPDGRACVFLDDDEGADYNGTCQNFYGYPFCTFGDARIPECETDDHCAYVVSNNSLCMEPHCDADHQCVATPKVNTICTMYIGQNITYGYCDAYGNCNAECIGQPAGTPCSGELVGTCDGNITCIMHECTTTNTAFCAGLHPEMLYLFKAPPADYPGQIGQCGIFGCDGDPGACIAECPHGYGPGGICAPASCQADGGGLFCICF